MQNFNLKEKKIKPSFQTPSQYFEDFEKKIMLKIESEKISKPKLLNFTKFQYSISTAAAVLIVALLLVYMNESSTKKSLEADLIEEYLLSQSSEEDSLIWDEIASQTSAIPMDLNLNLNIQEIELYMNKNADLEYFLE